MKDFANNIITLKDNIGKVINGILCVENTGIELRYTAVQKNDEEIIKSSYLLYKSEFGKIELLIRYHDDLNDKNKMRREKELKKTYHPSFLRRMKRTLLNVIKLARDSVLEVINLITGQIRKSTPVGKILTPQKKYVNQIKQDLLDTAGTAYEPLLEKYIGHKVVCEVVIKDELRYYSGILKEYTSKFIEILDVAYKSKSCDTLKNTDLIIPRNLGALRHFGEN